MSLYIGTREGLFQAPESSFDSPEIAVDCGYTRRLRTFPDASGLFATSESGLYHTEDGADWEQIETPRSDVWEVLVDGDEMYVGTSPAEVYRSTDRGETWHELESLQEMPDRELWRSAPKPEARIRSIRRGAGESDRLFVGVEAGGLFVSDDGGETWDELDVQGHTDLHQVVPLAPDEFLVVCGRLSIHDMNHAASRGGIFHTTNGGESFNLISDAFEPYYIREMLLLDETLYVGASLTIPPVWNNGGSGEGYLLESDDMIHFSESSYPGGPEEVILAWGTSAGKPIAGTAVGALRDAPEGRVIRRDGPDEWTSLGTVPSHIHALASF